MNLLEVNLKEIGTLYGFEPHTRIIDNEVCVQIGNEDDLAAMHFHSGSEEDLKWVSACLTGLRERNIHGCSTIIPTITGDVAVKSGDCYIYFTDYVPGTGCDGANTFEVRSIGRLLGEIHAASDDILYFYGMPEARQSPPWLQAAQERTAYWRLASVKYRQAGRGEALRLLLNSAQASISRCEELLNRGDGAQVLSFARLSFAKFVYLPGNHRVYFNASHECYVDRSVVTLAEMLLDLNYSGSSALHFLSAYQAVRPLSPSEIQMLLAYLSYPHEWAKGLDELTRGRPNLRASGVLEQIEKKREWIEWLAEKLVAGSKHREGGFLDMDMKKKVPELTGVQAQGGKVAEAVTEIEQEVVEETVAVVETVEVEAPVEAPLEVEAQAKKIVEPAKENTPITASIVWKPFPKALGESEAPVEVPAQDEVEAEDETPE